MMTAVAALLVLALILGGFALVLSRRARQGAGVAQLPAGTPSGDGRLLPSPQGGGTPSIFGIKPPATNSPAAAPNGPAVTAAPTPNAAGSPVASVPSPNSPGGPPVVGGPQGAPNGPSVVAGPQGQAGGPSLLRGPQPGAGGPSVVRGPQGAPNGPPVVGGPQPAPNGPSVVSGPQGAPNGPPVVGGPQTAQAPQRKEPPLEDISGYLERLYRVEEMRHQLGAQLVTAVTNTTFQNALRAYTSAGMDDDNPQQGTIVQQTARDFEIVARRYEQLNLMFQRGTPPVPVSCRRLHAAYGLALVKMPSIVRGLRNALLRMDLGAVNMVQQLGQGTVERGFQIADSELERLANERRVAKPFDIGDNTRRPILGLP
jgi:hypothetical protein